MRDRIRGGEQLLDVHGDLIGSGIVFAVGLTVFITALRGKLPPERAQTGAHIWIVETRRAPNAAIDAPSWWLAEIHP